MACSHRLGRCSFLFIVYCMIGAGCAQQPKPAANPPVQTVQAGQVPPAQQSPPPAATPTQAPQAGQSQQQADVAPSTAVQQQAEAYAKLMQPLIDKRAQEQQQSMQADRWPGPGTPPG